MNQAVQELVQLKEYINSCIYKNEVKLSSINTNDKYIEDVKKIVDVCKEDHNLLLTLNDYTLAKIIGNICKNQNIKNQYIKNLENSQDLDNIYKLIEIHYNNLTVKKGKNYYKQELEKENEYYNYLLTTFDNSGFVNIVENIELFKDLLINSQLLPKKVNKILSLANASNKKLKNKDLKEKIEEHKIVEELVEVPNNEIIKNPLNNLTEEELIKYNSLTDMINLNNTRFSNLTQNNQNYILNLVNTINNKNRAEVYSTCEVLEILSIIILKDIEKINQEIIEVLEIMMEEANIEEWQIVKRDLFNDLEYCLNYIKIIEDKSKLEQIQEKKNIIFLPTSSGNIYFAKDLKNIPEDYYEDFLNMLDELKNGIFHSNYQKDRCLGPNNVHLKACCEKKSYKVRLQYYHMPNNVVLVLKGQMKEDNLSDLEERLNNQSTKNIVANIKSIIEKGGEPLERLIVDHQNIYNQLTGYMSDNLRKRNKR